MEELPCIREVWVQILPSPSSETMGLRFHMEIPAEKLEVCLEVLQQVSEDPSVISSHERMKGLIAKIHREGKRIARNAERESDQAEARRLRARTAVVAS